MRSHRRRLPTEHVFIAGDLADLPGIISALAWMPADTYGQVVVEASAADALPLLAAPPRVTVHRVEPSIEGPGVAAGRAVTAWAGEWAPDEPDAARDVTIWVGARVDQRCPQISGLVERL